MPTCWASRRGSARRMVTPPRQRAVTERVDLLPTPVRPDVIAAAAVRAGHSVELESITHRFGATTAVDDVRLTIEAGELVALLGPSGCGKTTLLRIIGGFITPTTGSVRVDGHAIDHLPASRRDIGIVFQNYALFPHMSVYENVAYGLRARRASRETIRQRVATMLAVVQLEALRDRLPRQLSGGQQQRVALARALAVEPRILLLDEPFGALDKNLRLDMQIEVKRLQRQFGITAILVTHDQEEAMSLADRIAVMHRGRVEQFASPIEVYDRPRTLFVNSFVGTANLLPGEVVGRDATALTIALDAGATVRLEPTQAPGGPRVVVSARPENLRLHVEPGAGRWPVELRIRMPVGAQMVSEVVTRDGQSLKITEPRASLAAPGQASGALYCGIDATAAVSTFPAPAAGPATP
jgi:putative spermidine/putrescine transport system ATP-binding protein